MTKENLLVELRGPFNVCCFKERCIERIEELEREVAELRHKCEVAYVYLWWDEKAGLWSTTPLPPAP